MTLIEKAKAFATKAHQGRFRRDGETPYITHPAAVVERLQGESDEVLAAAWLHDVLEDTDESTNTLAEEFPASVVEAVEALSRDEWLTYEQYIQLVADNPIARKVKISDMLANLSDSPTEKQIVKYSKALIYLHAKPTDYFL
jgi:(p)ppGpp synthase/HD superfamily hydrolase